MNIKATHQRVKKFWSKPVSDKLLSLRFFTRHAVSSVPYLPIRLRLPLSDETNERVKFWWSHLPPNFVLEKPTLSREYAGDDYGELRFLHKFLKGEMVFMDIGAYHGIYAVLAAKLVGPKGSVTAFEPSARERARLKANIHLNGFRNVKIESFALGSSVTTSELFVVSGIKSMNSLRLPNTPSQIKQESVEVRTLDGYCADRPFTRIDCLKVDVEGGELEVFRGAKAMLSKHRPLIICEVIDWVTAPWGYRAKEIISYLEQNDFIWYAFTREGNLFPHEYREHYGTLQNFLAVPVEKVALIQNLIVKSACRAAANQ